MGWLVLRHELGFGLPVGAADDVGFAGEALATAGTHGGCGTGGLGCERRSAHRTLHKPVFCAGYPQSLLQHDVFLFHFGSGQEMSTVVGGN